MSVKILLFSLLKGAVEMEPLGRLPRPLRLCLVLVNTRGPENAGVSVRRFRGSREIHTEVVKILCFFPCPVLGSSIHHARVILLSIKALGQGGQIDFIS